MQETTPQIFLVARPHLDFDGMSDYMTAIGGNRWMERIASALIQGSISHAEALVEFHARNCYRSFDVGLNANVTKVREDSAEYLRNILKQHHGSVLEHANFSFVFYNVSRVFTHELVRHRAGVAISQESLRYVRLTDLKVRIPEILADGPPLQREAWNSGGFSTSVPMKQVIVELVESLEEFQREAAIAFGLDDENVPFHVKKEVTSALRRLAPVGLSTTIGWTANLRTIRHVIEQRTAAGAEEEIQMVFSQVAAIMQNECPLLFGDYEYASDGSWQTEFGKV